MATYIEEPTANEVWKKAANMLLVQNNLQSGRTGNIYELLHTLITIQDPQQKWIYNRIPPISIGYALAELVWIMNGDDSAEIINFWNPSLHKFAGKSMHYHGAYGKRMRSHFGIDQLEKSYEALHNQQDSRQVVIQIYDTKVDFPIDLGKPRDEDIPCNICSLLKIRDTKLEWSQIARSSDVFLGIPYDVVQFTSLQEILAGWLEMGVGSYSHFSDSLHLYEKDTIKIAVSDDEEITNNDSLCLSKLESEIIFYEIYKRMKVLSTKKFTEKQFLSLAKLESTYSAYNNIMLIIAAYVSQQKYNCDFTSELIKECTNEAYKEMWNRWLANKNRSSDYV